METRCAEQRCAAGPKVTDQARVWVSDDRSRPFRVVADRTGMGEPIDRYNAHLAQVTHALYAAFGNGEMLRLNAEGT
jgi:hypothetical protein